MLFIIIIINIIIISFAVIPNIYLSQICSCHLPCPHTFLHVFHFIDVEDAVDYA